MDTIKNNTKVFGIATGVAVIATGLYLLVKKAIKEEEELQERQAAKQLNFEITQATTTTRLKVEYQGQHLTLNTISQIYDTILRIVAPRFKELTKKDREERRANKGNIKKYAQIWNSYAFQLELQIEQAQKEVLAAVKVPSEVWEASNAYHMSENSQELIVMHASLPQKLKMTLDVNKVLSKEQLKEILKVEIRMFEEELQDIEKIKNHTERIEEVGPILQNKIYDQLYEDFGVEEEDIYAATKKYIDDPEINQVFQELQKATMKVVSR